MASNSIPNPSLQRASLARFFFRWREITPWIVLTGALLAIVITIPDYGLTWDEPIYMEASARIRQWLDLPAAERFHADSIRQYWQTDLRRNVHPSGVKWLYLAAAAVIFWEDDPYEQNRIFFAILFILALAIFGRWWHSDRPGWIGVFLLLLLTLPRFFAHTHFASTDLALLAGLLLLTAGLERWITRPCFWLIGFPLGFFLSIKLTAALLILPVGAVLIYEHRREWRQIVPRLALIAVVGAMGFYALNPDYWYAPLSRLREFLAQSLTRAQWAPISTYFAGRLYSFRGPFYYPLVIFLITTPVLHLGLTCLGLGASFRDGGSSPQKVRTIWLTQGLAAPFLLLVLPLSPTIDGERYLLPAFPFAACFMVMGLEFLWGLIQRRSFSRLRPALAGSLAGLALFLAMVYAVSQVRRYHPYELAYYNELIGGPAGAFHRGFETGYWLEALNDEALARINEICAGSAVYFPVSPTDIYFRHQLLNRKIEFLPVTEPGQAPFMLIYGRPSVAFWEVRERPVMEKNGRAMEPIWELPLDGIPLLRLYRLRSVRP